MTMSKNMVRLTKLKKRKKEFAEKYQMLRTRNTFAKSSLSKIKVMAMEDISTKTDFTILEISKIVRSTAMEQNITLMGPLKTKVNGKMENS